MFEGISRYYLLAFASNDIYTPEIGSGNHSMQVFTPKHITGIERLKTKVAILFLALPISTAGQVLPFHTYTTKDGLPSNEIHVLYQDSRGYLWIGTAEGLSVYDGNTFTNYSAQDGLGFNYVTAVIEDRTSPGTMWIATSDAAVSKFENGSFTRYKIPAGIGEYSHNNPTLMQDHAGTIWYGADSGIYHVRQGIISKFRSADQFKGVAHLIEVNDSLIWIVTSFALYRYRESVNQLERLRLPSDPSRFIMLEQACIDSTGTLWIAALSGDIFEVHGPNDVRVHQTGIPASISNGTYYFLTDDNEGNLYAGTEHGFLTIPKRSITAVAIARLTAENGLPENNLRNVLIDRENNLWIACFLKGLVKLTDRSVVQFPLPGILSGSINNGLGVVDSAAHFWLILQGVTPSRRLMEIWHSGSGSWRTYVHAIFPDLAASDELLNLQQDSRGYLWISMTPHRYICLEVRHRSGAESQLLLKRDFRLSVSTPTTGSLCFIVDRRGYIWVSNEGDGVYAYDPQRPQSPLRVIAATDWVAYSSIRAIHEDARGNLWFGGFDGGLAMLPSENWQHATLRTYTTADGLPDNKIRSIISDSDGRLLVGTRLGGLAILDGDKFRTLTTRDGLLSNTIWCMARDTRGKIWLGTNLGVQSFDPRTNGDFWTNKEFYGMRASGCGVFKDEYVWMATEGLTIYRYPGKDVVQHVPPPTHITRIAVNGHPIRLESDQEFLHNQNNITVSFVGISFRDERLNRYQYRLLENDRDWQPLTKQTSVNYAALKPGTYTFEVKAISADGIESTKPAIFSFTILSPFWMRWWFIVLVAICLIALILLVYQYRVNQLLKIERMRTRIATDLHDDIGASLTRIALFSEVAKEEAEKASPRLMEMAEKIGMNARELLDSVGTLVWSIDPRHDRFEDVLTHLKNFAQEMLSMKGIEYTFTVQEEATRVRLPLDARKNLLLIFKEAINNIVKHSRCQNVAINLELRDGAFHMSIADDGRGLASTILRPGHGLMNMRNRAESIGGTFDIQTEKDHGVTILLRIPIDGGG